MLLKLEDLNYVTSLELNMGYYHIHLREDVSNLFTMIIPWVKYR